MSEKEVFALLPSFALGQFQPGPGRCGVLGRVEVALAVGNCLSSRALCVPDLPSARAEAGLC